MYYHYFGVFIFPDFSRLVGMQGRVFCCFSYLFKNILFIMLFKHEAWHVGNRVRTYGLHTQAGYIAATAGSGNAGMKNVPFLKRVGRSRGVILTHSNRFF